MTRRTRKQRNKDSVTSNVRLKPAGQVQVTPSEKPAEPPADKRIHPRRPLPLVPKKSANEEDE